MKKEAWPPHPNLTPCLKLPHPLAEADLNVPRPCAANLEVSFNASGSTRPNSCQRTIEPQSHPCGIWRRWLVARRERIAPTRPASGASQAARHLALLVASPLALLSSTTPPLPLDGAKAHVLPLPPRVRAWPLERRPSRLLAGMSAQAMLVPPTSVHALLSLLSVHLSSPCSSAATRWLDGTFLFRLSRDGLSPPSGKGCIHEDGVNYRCSSRQD
jgi:hypothetical protein